MADKEALDLFDTARMLQDKATNKGLAFLNTELDLSPACCLLKIWRITTR